MGAHVPSFTLHVQLSNLQEQRATLGTLANCLHPPLPEGERRPSHEAEETTATCLRVCWTLVLLAPWAIPVQRKADDSIASSIIFQVRCGLVNQECDSFNRSISGHDHT